MNRFIQAYQNFKQNDLNTCRKVGLVLGLFFLVSSLCNSLYRVGIGQSDSFPVFVIATIFSICVGYFFGLFFSSVLYYFAELVSPRREKSYLPNEKKEE